MHVEAIALENKWLLLLRPCKIWQIERWQTKFVSIYLNWLSFLIARLLKSPTHTCVQPFGVYICISSLCQFGPIYVFAIFV